MVEALYMSEKTTRKRDNTTPLYKLADIDLDFDAKTRTYHRITKRTVDLVWANGYKEGGICGYVAAHELIEIWINSNYHNAWDTRPIRPQHTGLVRVEIDPLTVVYYLNSDHLCTVRVTK